MKLRPITERPSTIKPMYCCPVCGTFYHAHAHAQHCRDSYPLDQQFPGLKVGDVIMIHQGYTWFHQQAWVADKLPADPNHSSHFRHRDQYTFYFVVTHIGVHHDAKHPRVFSDNRHGHRGCISVASRAICQDDTSPVHAWTTPKRHVGYKRCENQDAFKHLVEEVKDLLGKPSTILLL